MDFGKTFRHKRIFGANKTFRGFVFGVFIAILITSGQYFLAQKNIINIEFLNSFGQYFLFGFLSGFGALLGDAIESFFKRQIGIAPGRPFIPLDQIDYLIMFILFTDFLAN